MIAEDTGIKVNINTDKHERDPDSSYVIVDTCSAKDTIEFNCARILLFMLIIL